MTVAHSTTACSRSQTSVPVFLTLSFFALASGVLIAEGGPTVGIATSALLLGAVALLIPITWMFWLLALTTFLFSGPVQYFGHIQKAFWIPYLLGLLLLLKSMVEILFARTSHETTPRRNHAPGVVIVFILYILALCSSTIFNLAPLFQVLLSSKEYFFLLGAGLAVYWGLVSPVQVDRLLRHSHWFLIAQLPVILYQRFVIAARRTGDSSWDSVVGLMSGDPEGGGASASMALLVLLVMTFHLAAWRTGTCRTPKLLLVLLLGLTSIMLAEVKFAIILLPMAFALVYLREIIRRPVLGAVVLTTTLALTVMILVAYQAQFSAKHTKSSRSVADYVDVVIERNTGYDSVNMATGEMGRVASLTFWWENHGADNPVHFFLGHGIGASRIGVVSGEVARRYPFKLSRSTLSALLWEGGLIAAIAALSLLGLGAIKGFSRARQENSHAQQATLKTSAIGLVLALTMMPYGPDILYVSQAQLLVILMAARILAPAMDPKAVPA